MIVYFLSLNKIPLMDKIMSLYPMNIYIYHLGGSVVKNSPAKQDSGSVPGSGRFPRERSGNPPSILTWEILWTGEPGGLQSRSRKELDTT